MFDCSSYYLRGLTVVKTIKAQLLFCSQRIWYPLFYRPSISGNFLSVLFYSCLILPSVMTVCGHPNSSANKEISFSQNVSLLAALSPSCHLDWFYFISYMAFVTINSMDYLKCDQWFSLNMMNSCEVWRSSIYRNNHSKFKLLRCSSQGVMESPSSSREPTQIWPWCSSPAWPLAASCVPPQAQGKWGGPPCPFGPG